MTIPTSTPSAQGIDPAGLISFIDAIEADPVVEPHGLIIQRHGHRVVEAFWSPHRAGRLRLVYSLSKTFTGTALGLALGDGIVSLDDRVVDLLADRADDVDERTARMLVRHIASMATGHQDETLLDAMLADPTDVVDAFLHLVPQHDPGTWFAYNQPPVLALATILQERAGARLVDQLRERVLDRIGIGDLRWAQYQPGIDVGFTGVFTDLDAIARLGQLHLDDGVWDGERVLPEGWVSAASSMQIDNSQRPEPDWSQGYGFQLWMCQHGYRGDGAFGQYMVVLPEQDAVIAFFSHTEPMQPFLDHLWEHLLPAFGERPSAPDGTDADPDGDRAVAQRLADLSLPTAAQRDIGVAPAQGLSDSTRRNPAAGPAVGSFSRAGDRPSHFSITGIDVGPDDITVQEGDTSIVVPLSASWVDVPGHPIATSAAVRADGGLVVDLVMVATPHRLEVTTDPSTSTFSAAWTLLPLFGFGIDGVLSHMGPPD